MKKLGLILLLFLILCSCKKSLKDKIIAKFEEKCKGDSVCIIDLKELTDFKWDKFYLVDLGVDPDKALGFRYPYWEDMATRIIFTLGNRVTYHEDEFPDLDNKYDGGLAFDIRTNNTSYWSCSSKNAVFTIKKIIYDDLIYYKISPIKQDTVGEITRFKYR